MIVVTIIRIVMAIHYFLKYTLGFLYLSSSGFANAQLRGCFHPWTFSCRGVTICLLYVGPLLEICFKMIAGLWVWYEGKQLFCCFWLFYILILTPYNIILHFRLPYFHVSNSALFSTCYFGILIYIDVVLTLSTDWYLELFWWNNTQMNAIGHRLRLYR